MAESTAPTSAESEVKKAEFPDLAGAGKVAPAHGNLELVRDIHVSLTVELGRTDMVIQDILELTPGKVIELDRLAGEPLDIVVNGKLLAKGEVVVVDENFGVRITSIVDSRAREAAIKDDEKK
ncbi:MAG: flagellar motor switch protein FliN [Planctomycetes bacterium]|nr:flagellar motor switch protein FliN [Planctomycetota bacterium]